MRYPNKRTGTAFLVSSYVAYATDNARNIITGDTNTNVVQRCLKEETYVKRVKKVAKGTDGDSKLLDGNAKQGQGIYRLYKLVNIRSPTKLTGMLF